MSDEPTEFRRLMKRVRTGCPEAARELFERYGGHVRRVVRRKLHQRLRPQFDSTDFTQAVWASFFATPADEFAFDTPDALVAFLAGMAYHKVTDAYRRRMRSAKCDARREVALPKDGLRGEGNLRDPRQQTPSQVAIANETWDRLLERQPSHYRLALELLRRGHTQAEAAARVGLDPRQIRRLLEKLNRDSCPHE
jgi:RNA polymerase sigma factor (sigma-70 family)